MAMATGTNRVALGPRPQVVAEGGGDGDEEEMADVDREEEAARGARDITMAEIETATRTATAIETDSKTGALATNDSSDPAQLRKVIQVDHCGAGHGSRTQGGRYMLARATERKTRYWDQPFGI
jgi:hypothetical protein